VSGLGRRPAEIDCTTLSGYLAAMGRIGGIRRGWVEFRKTIMYALLARQRKWLFWLVVTAAGASLGAVGYADTLQKLVDTGIVAREHPISYFVGRLVLLAFWSLGFGIALRQVIARLTYHLEFELRIWLYERLQSTDPERLDALSTGQMVTRAMTDLLLLEQVVLVVPTVALVGSILLAVFALMAAINWWLAIIAILMLPANLWIVLRIRRRLWGLSWVTLDRRARVTTVIDEAVRGARVVKAFGREAHENDRLETTASSAYAAAMTRIRLVSRYDMLLAAVPGVIMALLTYLGAREGVNGHLTAGRLLVFFLFALVFAGFARIFGYIQSAWQFAKTGAGRIFELIAYARPATLEPGVPLPGEGPGLELRQATVRIHDHPVLAPLTFRAAPGELVVVAGPPRSGKTTLARLVAGGCPLDGGTATLDGVPIADADVRDLRRAVRVVVEDPFLFGRTVRENLLLGAPEGTGDDVLWAALTAAGARQVVEDLPNGLDTVLGDRGLTVSGGQRQRLALACALVTPPRVLVLDDALSAVDPALEIAILGRLTAHAPHTAVVAITRRASAATVADQVVELPEPGAGAPKRPRATGSLATDGPYDLLLAGIVAQLPPDRDEPDPTNPEATSDAAPTVPGLLQPFRRVVIAAGLLLLGFTLAGLVPTWMTQVALDAIAKHSTRQGLLAALVTLGAAGAVAVCTYFFKIEAKKVEEGVGYVLRRRAFGRLMRLGVDFYDRELPGRVAARVVHDLDKIAIFLESGVYDLAGAITLLLMSFVVIAVWQPSVALAISGVLPVLALLTALQLRPASRAYRDARLWMGEVVARLQEDFAGRHVIEAAGAEDESRTAFVRMAYELRQARKRSNTIANCYIEAMTCVGSLAGAALVNTAAHRVFEGGLSVGGMVALQLFLIAALAPIPTLSDVLQRYLAARASFRTLSEPFAAPVRPTEPAATSPCEDATGDIVLDGVTFSYPGTTREVLHHVDLTIPSGATVAVVGPTGAGKSSIAKLVARVYDPDAGTVTVGGTDIRAWELTSYRRRIGVVPQDGFCFRGTVAENIAYGRPDADRADIEAAAQAVGALDAVLGLVGGLDARVEEEGRNLTAAQVQLIALARAWLMRPDLLILDEATSSLDPDTERHVLAATRAMDCTTIMVTHRLPVAQSADTVLVVSDGAIVESGSPATLKRRKGGAYAALWKAGPEIEARVAEVATSASSAYDDADAAAGLAVAAAAGEDPEIVRQVLADLRSGALGADAHTLDGTAPGGGARPAATAALAGMVIGETDEELEAFLVGAGGVAAMAESVLDALRSAIDPAVVGDLRVGFEVGDGEHRHRWVLASVADASGATLEKAEADADAALSLGLSGPDLLRLAIGQLDAIDAVMTGRIVLTGDLEQIARLSQIFAAGPALAMA
jgi:ATP-binding cassette subfamily B protein